MDNKWHPVGGIPSDALDSEVIGERRIKVGLSDRIISQGNNLDRLLVQNLDYRDDVIAQGAGFFVDYHQTAIPANSKTYVQVQAPSDRYMAIIDREFITDKDRAFYRAFTSYSAVTETTEIPIQNLRTNSPLSSTTTVFQCTAPTTIDQTSIISNVPIFGTVGSGNRSSGGISASGLFRLIEPGLSILFEWENATNSTMYFETQIAWFELPESAIIT